MTELATTLPPGPLEPETGDDERLPSLPAVICAHRAFHADNYGAMVCVDCGKPLSAVTRHGATMDHQLDRIASGDLMPDTAQATIARALADVRRRFDGFVGNIDALNRSLGEFRDQVIQPMRGELQALKYNLGDQTTTAVSQLTGLLHHFDKGLTAMLKVAQVDPEAFKTHFGIAENVPSLMELEREGAPSAAAEALHEANTTLAAQNSRLIAEVEKLRRGNETLRAQVKRARKAKVRRRG